MILQVLMTTMKLKGANQRTYSKKYSKKSTKTIRKIKKFDDYHRVNETVHQNILVQKQKKMKQPSTSNVFQGIQLLKKKFTDLTNLCSFQDLVAETWSDV